MCNQDLALARQDLAEVIHALSSVVDQPGSPPEPWYPEIIILRVFYVVYACSAVA